MNKFVGIVVLLLSLVAAGQASARSHVCFSVKSNKYLPFKVIRQVAPPRRGDEHNYRFWPLTGVATGRIDLLGRQTNPVYGTYHFMWANRCEKTGNGKCRGHNPKGNIIAPRPRVNGREVRPFFNSLAKADTCTMLQTRYILGDSKKSLVKKASRSGLKLVGHTRNLLSHARGGRFSNVCVLPKSRLSKWDEGIVLDYEVQDGRTSRQAKAFLLSFANLVQSRGKQAILYTNPLDAPTQRYSSINRSNAAAIYKKFDAIGLLLHHRNKQGSVMASYRSQEEIIKAGLGGKPIDYRKILIGFEMRDTTMNETRQVRNVILKKRISGVIMWRNRARPGGSCKSRLNRKLACLFFGRC